VSHVDENQVVGSVILEGCVSDDRKTERVIVLESSQCVGSVSSGIGASTGDLCVALPRLSEDL